LKLKHGSGQDKNWRILIVEDDERLANLTKDYLGNNDLKVFNQRRRKSRD
jgi:DNA-binding response OmpR family regulator